MIRMARLWAAMACLAACGDGGLSRFDGEDVPPPPPIGQAERVRIVGSSTVAPFSTTVAEHFGAATRFATPIVETTGSGGGFKAFCRDIGPDEPAIANASRRIKPSEIELCAAAGVTQIVPVPIGYDGIVLANAKTGPRFDITKAQLYLALADALPDGDGRWRSNPHKSWSDVDPALPDEPILVSGPPPTSGTRDAFVEIAMEAGALALPELQALKTNDPDAFLARAHTIRTDGAWIDSGENDTAIIQTLIKNPAALGVLGYSFLDQNADRVKAAKIAGVEPTFEAIASGDYTISRSLYFYVKAQNLPLTPGLLEYVDAFTAEDTWGPDGYLAEKGLIPLPEARRAEVRAAALALEPLGPEDT